MNKLLKLSASVSIVAMVVLSYAGMAGAVTPYPAASAVADSTSYIGDLTSGLVPTLLAIATGIVGITVLSWGIRTVFHKVRGAAHF